MQWVQVAGVAGTGVAVYLHGKKIAMLSLEKLEMDTTGANPTTL
jgi:hypothetical protein